MARLAPHLNKLPGEITMIKNKFLILPVFVLLALSLAACAKSNTVVPTATTPVPAGLIAEGSLMPVQALDQSFTVSGQVDKVLVKDGQTVKQGEVLASLKNTAAAQLALAQAQQEELSAQQSYDQISQSTSSGALAELNLAQAQYAYNVAYGNYWNRDKSQGSADAIALTRARLQILDNQIADLQDKYNSMGEQANTETSKALVLQTLSQARLDREDVKKLLDYYEANPNAVDVQTLKAKMDVAKANLDDAQRVVDRLKDGIDPNELAAAQARLTTAHAAVSNAQSALDALQLKASMSGTIVDVNVLPGQQVTALQTLMSVADLSGWVVETDNLTETEIVNVTVGQKVKVVLDALPNVELAGTVTHINDRFVETRGDVTYTVTVTLDDTDPRMRWGMTAAVYFE
jgi:multidrug resistance efflux pump